MLVTLALFVLIGVIAIVCIVAAINATDAALPLEHTRTDDNAETV